MIVLFTDFGLAGPYIGQVEAVLRQQAPGVPVISLFADLHPFDIRSAAYLLPAYITHFPPGTVFLCVVDPGVGSARPAVVVKADHRWYVGPNEGLFALLTRRADQVECWQLPVDDNASATFHGRDVFAPIAARLARGLASSGEAMDPVTLEQGDWPDDLAQVVYIDRYGNAITGLRATMLDDSASVEVDDRTIRSARNFADVPAGEAFWYANANGLVEVAVSRGRAAQVLQLAVGQDIVCR